VWSVVLLVGCSASTLSDALRLASLAVEETHRSALYCSIAVNGIAGETAQVFFRTGGASLSTIKMAIALSQTAMDFGVDTASLVKSNAPRRNLFGIESAVDSAFFAPGGVLVSQHRALGVACNVQEDGDQQDFAHVIAKAARKRFLAGEEPQANVFEMGSERETGSWITLADAVRLALSALKREPALAVSVVDIGGNLKVSIRGDNVPRAASIASFVKAKTTKYFDLGMSSGLNDASEPGSPAYGVQVSNGGLYARAGGSSLVSEDDIVVGAVGIESFSIDSNLLAGIAAATAGEFNSTSPTLRQRRGLTSLEAQRAISLAIAKRKDLGTEASPGVYAVRDLTGKLKAFYVEDGCEGGALDIALKSSETSILFGIPSASLGKLSLPDNNLFGIEALFGGIVSFESAQVLRDGAGEIIGSIGVSGTGNGKGTRNDGLIAEYVAGSVDSSLWVDDPCRLHTERCYSIPDPIMETADWSSSAAETVSLRQASSLVDAGIRYCVQNSQSACVSVLSTGFDLKAQYCMDDSFLGAVDLTSRKAKTAGLFGKPNEQLSQAQLPGSILFKVELTNGGLFTNAGGLPLKYQGSVVGAIGVAGASDDAAAVQATFFPWRSFDRRE